MCGIMGFIGNPTKRQKYEFLTKGLSLIEIRGRDATGIFSSQVGILKAPLQASDFLASIEVKKFIKRIIATDSADVVFGHTRAGTHGGPEDNNNNHPLFTDDCVLVHNGVVRGDKIKGYPYKGKTDTEELLAYIQNSSEKTEEGRITEGITNVSGSLAIAIYFRKSGNTYLYRDTSPLYAGKLGSSIIFASTERILKSSINSFREGSFFRGVEIQEIPENILLKVKKGNLTYLSKVVPKTYTYKSNYVSNRYNSYNNSWESQDSFGRLCDDKDTIPSATITPINNLQENEAQLTLPAPLATTSLGKSKTTVSDKIKGASKKVIRIVRNIGNLHDANFFRIKHGRYNYVFSRHNDEYALLGENSFNLMIEVSGSLNHPAVYLKNNYSSFNTSRPEIEEDIIDLLYGEDPFERSDSMPITSGTPTGNPV